jgi:hypothetical protein
MSRLQPIPYGLGILLVPDFCNSDSDERIVMPRRRRKGYRRDRV